MHSSAFDAIVLGTGIAGLVTALAALPLHRFSGAARIHAKPCKLFEDIVTDVELAIRNLVIANRILGKEGVVDAFGHVSIRHPADPSRYFLSRSRSPELVVERDIMEFDLDSNAIEQRGRTVYSERFIHGCVYKARSDVMAVCHSHAHALVPFTVTDTSIQPIWVMSAAIGNDVPVWDIREDFPSENTMLVVNDAIGMSMVRKLGSGRAVLLRGHGAVIAAADIKKTVLVSIGLMRNAEMLVQSHLLSLARGKNEDIRYLNSGEIEFTTDVLFNARGLNRAWEYWTVRAGFSVADDNG
jgi:ribulose-5-phosphate 4-epimerase/fuculose-1-phosphate aldolase